MKQTNENIIIQLASPERKFVKVYQDFLQNELLTAEEKIVFIVLKSFVDFKTDSNSVQGEAYPTMETVCRLSSLSKPRATKAINKLIEKKIVRKIRRGLTKSNIYTLSDYAAMWTCDNIKDMTETAQNKGIKPSTLDEYITELKKMGYTVELKEKELASDSGQTIDTSTHINKIDAYEYSIDKSKSQAERYTLNQIQQLFEYDAMIHDYEHYRQEIDSVMNILHTTMNTTKTTIRIGGEDKPAMAVSGKLMKLDKESIIYAIKKFSEQTERVKNPAAYMLTILYSAPEQFNLDIKNQLNHNMAHW